MTLAALVTIFAVGFIIMAPIGPVSTVCIRRTLLYGPRAGSVAGAGAALAVAAYSIIGVTGSTLVARFFAPYAAVWHVAVAVVLVGVAILIWRSKPELPEVGTPKRAVLAGGFGAAMALTLANPADIVLFAAIFAGLGIAVHTPADHVAFCLTIFAGGCAYWIALALLLDRWRAGLTSNHIRWLNRTCSVLMIGAAAASIGSLAHVAG